MFYILAIITGSPKYINGSPIGCGWRYAYFAQNWMDSSNPAGAYDWAILVLEQDLGSTVGYVTPTVTNYTSLLNTTINIVGYPLVNGSSGNVYKSSGTVSSGNNMYISYNSNTAERL